MIPRTRRDSRRGGFTLIEVLLVLVILVIIGSMAVIAYGPMQERAYINTAKTQINLFEQPLQLYKIDMGTFPNAAQGLEALRTPPAGLANVDDWKGPYIGKPVPLDPWKNQYRYEYPGNNRATCPTSGRSARTDSTGVKTTSATG